MNNFCDHFLTLKQQKIANFIKKSTFKCNNYKHTDVQYTLCLHCGQTRCNTTKQPQQNSNNNSCSILHYQSNKHPLILKLLSCYVYCYTCQIQIQSMLEQQQQNGRNNTNYKNKLDKAINLYQKIRDLAIKNLPNIYSQRKTHKKSNNNQDKKQITNLTKTDKPNLISSNNNKNSKQLRVFGLANIGNTCYFNSILQCLYSTLQLHSFYSQKQFKDDLNIAFKKFLNNTQKVFSPKNIFSLLSKGHKFLKSMDQQDAFQLYVLLTDTLIQSCANKQHKITYKQKIQNSIGKIFGFNCANRLQCLNCGKISWNKDFNLGLTISLTKNINKNIHTPQNQPIPQAQIGQSNLYYPDGSISNNFLDNYFNPQLLSKNNSFKCQNCNQSSAIHKFYIKTPPQVLTINFKRFNNSGAKINTTVAIPTQINLNPHCLQKGNYYYQLYAGTVHSGSSRGGHYIAYTKRNNQWYYFSDSHYKPASVNSLKQSHPYVVFYRRISTDDGQQQDSRKQYGKTIDKNDSNADNKQSENNNNNINNRKEQQKQQEQKEQKECIKQLNREQQQNNNNI